MWFFFLLLQHCFNMYRIHTVKIMFHIYNGCLFYCFPCLSSTSSCDTFGTIKVKQNCSNFQGWSEQQLFLVYFFGLVSNNCSICGCKEAWVIGSLLSCTVLPNLLFEAHLPMNLIRPSLPYSSIYLAIYKSINGAHLFLAMLLVYIFQKL